MKLPPTHPAEDEALYQTTLTVRQCARDRTRTHTHKAPPLAPGRSDTGAGPIRGQTPDQICKGKKHQRPPRRATSARSCPTPKLTVSVSLDRKEQPLPKWAWPGRSLGFIEYLGFFTFSPRCGSALTLNFELDHAPPFLFVPLCHSVGVVPCLGT